MNYEQELANQMSFMDTGTNLEIFKDQDGGYKIRSNPMPYLRSPMSQAEPQTLEQTKKDVVPTLVGLPAGAAAATLGTLQDIAGLIYGGAKAMGAEEGQKMQTFLDTAGEISDKYGSGAVKGYIRQKAEEAGLDEDQLKVLDEAMMAGEFGGIGGMAKAAVTKGPQALSKAGDMVEGAGDAAKARMAEGGATLTSGVDPDPLIAAAGDAVKAARSRYEASPNDPSARQAYLDARHERDAQLSSMPVEEKLETDVSYRMAHQPTTPQDGAARLDDMTGGGTVFPDDVYSSDAVRLYGGNNPADQESANVIQSVRGNPEAEVTIYRAVPKDVDAINPGDWVTLSKRYADDHAESGYGQMGDEAGKVISQKVKVKDVYSDGNDLNEFGYFPEDIAETNVAKLEPPTEKQPGIIAFHGSGADFDEFKLEKIGTGEGAQAYGYGLYFTDSEDIAKFYRDSISRGRTSIVYDGDAVRSARQADDLTDREMILDTIAGEMAFFDQKPENVIARKIKNLKQKIDDPVDVSAYGDDAEAQELKDTIIASAKRDLEIYESIDPDKFAKGKMYKVGLAPKPEDMLDYQGTFADQPKKVQDALKAIGYEVETNRVGQKNSKAEIDFAMRRPMPVILDNLKKMFESENWQNELYGRGDRIISEKLLEQGVPGIKYRAAGSRGANVDAADAEMNYVIFDDKMIKILEKYGIVGPVAITGIAASKQESEPDAGA